MALIELHDITKDYPLGEMMISVLKGVSLSIERGEYVALMGASGSGKSTLMNILGCLDRPTSGTYRLNGTDVSNMSDNALSDHRLKNLGFVFQSFHLIPQLTVLDNIEMPMFYLGVPKAERTRRAKELAEKVEIDHRLSHLPSELSGGQRQRVAVARALANDPAVLLADEPTGNLDSKTSVQIMGLFQELYEQGKTVIVVTHEPDIDAYAKSHIVVKDGRILKYEV
jgi:putative ABC transport system ATP-binding protein